ncbi:helix-turn-helix domain-containing protein [Pseudooceanicola nanhaiensis]|jgi:transcriptional regulator with XRE-family HTH domain|uniref:helix-turn-helix domain-containing protein n=1 Tax=Pseudooceanicola nanhaiensis TaxID=375761 RepID=UPI0009FC330D|nr:helix-turn-helix transcriptional regulator [Pseudooceanicola nanhaiensis]
MAGTLHSQEYKDVVTELVRVRKAAGLSQAALAELLGRPPSYVAKVELCERRLDVVEFFVWLSVISDDPGKLITEIMGKLPKRLPH